MRYSIIAPSLDCKYLELTAEDYQSAKTAKEGLLVALDIEEKFNLVIENYAELEIELLKLTFSHLLFPNHFDWSRFMEELQLINRRLSNMLSSGRLYADQVTHEMSDLYGKDSEQFKEVASSFSEEYDGCLAYRVMYELRNFTQHRSLPIYQLSYSSEVDPRENGQLVKNSCIPSLNVKKMQEEGGFKEKALNDLKSLGNELVDIRPLVRDYIECISRVHVKLRARMACEIELWEGQFKKMRELTQNSEGQIPGMVALVTEDDAGNRIDSFMIFDDMVKRCRYLNARSFGLNDRRNHFVSSEE